MVVACILLGLASCWRVQEDDIYGQIRAGDELVHGHPVQTVDEWSYTVRGQPWTNYAWLSSVLFRGAYELGREPALVIFRILLISIWFGLIGLVIAKNTSASMRSLVFFCLAPWIYLASLFRLHLRPETFGLLIFTLLIALWSKSTNDKDSAPASFSSRRRWISIGLVWLWANLHGGTAIFGLGAVLVFFWGEAKNKDLSSDRARSRILWAVAAIAAFFATPVGFKIVPELMRHMHYRSDLLFNSEWQPIAFEHLRVTKHGWPIALWICLCLAGWAATAGSTYRHPKIAFLFGAALTYLAFSRIRCTPYVTLFFLPALARVRWPKWIAIGMLALWGILLPLNILKYRDLWGLGVNERMYPVKILEFIHKARPQGRLFTTMLVGSAQSWFLPEYPVFIDSRDVIFDPVKLEYANALANPALFAQLTRKYEVNTVLVDVPLASVDPSGAINDPLQASLPRADWAIVRFDDHMALAVRRIPVHQTLIRDFEYEMLRPSLPPTSYAFSKEREPNRDARFYKELARCLVDEPTSVFCLTADAAEHVKRKTPADLETARSELELARRQPGPKSIHTLALLSRTYELLHLSADAAEIDREISRGAEK